jgi:hypothetical protein
MSLINGMDDIMTHIKNQELRIQKLEQENKELKEENEKLKGENKEEKEYQPKGGRIDMEGVAIYYQNLYEKQKKEIAELTEKLQKFKERNFKRRDDLVKALSPWKKNFEDHTRILEAIIELKFENERLKEENKKDNFKFSCLGIDYKELYELQQKETDIEHNRYLEYLEKWSNLKNKCECCVDSEEEEETSDEEE